MSDKNSEPSKPCVLNTFDGNVTVEWDPDATVTPLGQLPFFIEFLKAGGRFSEWVDDCPLHYTAHNAPKKIDLLGSLYKEKIGLRLHLTCLIRFILSSLGLLNVYS